MLSALMRRWFCRPKRSDRRPLAQFYFADEDLTRVTAELNGIDLRKDPQKYLVLLNQLRISQDRVLRAVELVMEDCISAQRQSRDYHVKFPDEILHENLGVQLWFAAECLLVGSFLEVRESEGLLLRPLAGQLLCCLEDARLRMREQCLSDPRGYSPRLREALLQYDRVFAQFELSYISMVIPVKSAEELQRQQEIVVLFCETVERALKLGYLSQELIDGYEPLVMFTIPRLAIICGLLIFPDGPLNLQHGPEGMSSLFSPFYSLLLKIRDLLRVLTKEELDVLERNLCAAESSDFLCSSASTTGGQGSLPGTDPTVDSRPVEDAPSVPGSCQAPATYPSHPCSSTAPPPCCSDTGVWPEHPRCPTPDQEAVGCDRRSPVSHEKWGATFPGAACALCSSGFQEQGRRQPAEAGESGPAHVPDSGPQGSGEQAGRTAGRAAAGLCSHRSPYPSSPGADTEAEARERKWRRRVMVHSWHSGQPFPSVAARRPFGDGRRIGSEQENQTSQAGVYDERVDLRARYSCSNDLIHRLFVCISGVADQLQTNFASDMRAILKCVFELIVSQDEVWDGSVPPHTEGEEEDQQLEEGPDPGPEECELCDDLNAGVSDMGNIGGPPVWVPDSACDHCTACQAPFTILRRRHHCRSCGKIFCARCSPHEAPLPRFGQMKPVRVCNHCYDFHIVGETTPL
ncbi:lateral signaling target protein 2 homolog [Lepisosteus oculatus]|uniref:lateral signaling target protein 2 homolog n=1 Tax=Lepisosteus oculatus TaxID=7918 RepID=UPI0035F51EC2